MLDVVRPRRPTSRARFAANCLLARRLVERGVRFVQLFHRGWDQHGNLPDQHPAASASDIDQPSAALVADLKQRGLLDDTLVVWGGEFGRTVYSQGRLTGQLRPRPPRPLLHRSGWPAAASSRASSTARPTTSATTSSATRSTSTRRPGRPTPAAAAAPRPARRGTSPAPPRRTPGPARTARPPACRVSAACSSARVCAS